MSIRGTPDIIGCINGRFIGLELKAYKKDPSPMQKIKLANIAKAGGFARVVYPENFEEIYKELLCLSSLKEKDQCLK